MKIGFEVDSEPIDYTLYVGPHLVIRQNGEYTKHIYLGSQRIVSKIGQSNDYNAGVDPSSLSDSEGSSDALKRIQLEMAMQENYDHFEIDLSNYIEEPNQQGEDLILNNTQNEGSQYYYSSDHLGSSSYITDASGQVIEHLEYIAFGEAFVQEMREDWSTPYRFTGKEQDCETGLYYYGARYYDPKVSRFLSVDPLVHKFPGWSPYNYTLDNPIVYTDPDGRSPISVLAKMVAKQGVKAGIRAYAKKQIRGRLQNYMSKNMAKQFAKDLDGVLEILDNSWWETAIELVPVVGDVYGATKFGKKVAKAFDKLQDLENKYIDKIYESLPASEKKKFKKSMRNAGVRDARKDQAAGVDGLGVKYEKGKGVDGHHKTMVKDDPGQMTDPRNIEFMKK